MKAGALAAIFAFYIIHTNVMNFRYSRSALGAEKSALSAALGIIAFKASYALSAIML